jgi:shikimate dehydrogenase
MPLDPELLPAGVPVMDMIYGDTPFLRKAAERGCPTADGRGMLLHQGARSFEIWTGITPPVEAMRQALDAALAQRKP